MKENLVEVKDYLSRSNLPQTDYVINPYTGCPHKCMYCYAVFMKRFCEHMEEWGDFVDVKICQKPLNLNKLCGKKLVIGSVTDPYNLYEKKYRLMRDILEQIGNTDVKTDIITKSDLVIRDIDLLQKMSNLNVAVSMNSLDDSFRFDMEPYAPSVKRRINALKELKVSKISTTLFMSPIFVGITDFKKIIETTHEFVDEYWFENLNLRAAYKHKVLDYIYKKYPALKSLYQSIYNFKDISYFNSLKDEINKYCLENKIKHRIFFHHGSVKN